jgi:K+-transporting ATPase ATPase A chain
MSGAAWLQLVALVVLLAISTPLLGSYMAKVYGGGEAPGDRVFGPVERLIYRMCGVDEASEQRWQTYALSLLAFSFALLSEFAVRILVSPARSGAKEPPRMHESLAT